jgi:hypothetical protein
MACAAQWPAPACGWSGECYNGSCVCGDGYQVNPIVVDGVELCTVSPAAVDAMLALWLVGVLVSVPVTVLSIRLKARAERSVSRPAGRVEYLKNAVFALSSVMLTSGTALSLSGDGQWLFQNRAVTAVLCFAVVLCDLGLFLETVRYVSLVSSARLVSSRLVLSRRVSSRRGRLRVLLLPPMCCS